MGALMLRPCRKWAEREAALRAGLYYDIYLRMGWIYLVVLLTYSGLVEHVAEERVVGEDGLDALYSGGNVRFGQWEDVDAHLIR